MKRDKVIGAILLVVALSAISGLALITVFIFREGVPIIFRVGAKQFFLSTDWEPSLGHFGILSMMVGSFMVTIGAAVIGVVFSLGLAIVLTQFSPPGFPRRSSQSSNFWPGSLLSFTASWVWSRSCLSSVSRWEGQASRCWLRPSCSGS
jgi:ABC-type phosphate transport system permease subunit